VRNGSRNSAHAQSRPTPHARPPRPPPRDRQRCRRGQRCRGARMRTRGLSRCPARSSLRARRAGFNISEKHIWDIFDVYVKMPQTETAALQGFCSAPEGIRTPDLRFRRHTRRRVLGSAEPFQMSAGALRSPQNCGVRDTFRDTFRRRRNFRERLLAPAQRTLTGPPQQSSGGGSCSTPSARCIQATSCHAPHFQPIRR
jgi:hypothetical protein